MSGPLSLMLIKLWQFIMQSAFTWKSYWTYNCSWTSDSRIHKSSVSKPPGDTPLLELGWKGQLWGQEQPLRQPRFCLQKAMFNLTKSDPSSFTSPSWFWPKPHPLSMLEVFLRASPVCMLDAWRFCLSPLCLLPQTQIHPKFRSHPTCCENTLCFPSLVPGPTWKPPHLTCMFLVSLS